MYSLGLCKSHMETLVAQTLKNLPANAGDPGSIPGLGRSPGGGHGNSLQYSCLENLMDRAGYGPWGHKESDTAEVTASMHTLLQSDFQFSKVVLWDIS